MSTLVIAPHPDDELLGCGGTLLRRSAEGRKIAWLILTAMTGQTGWSDERIAQRAFEINQVREGLGIDPSHVYELGFPVSKLDTVPLEILVGRISEVFKEFEPEELFIPHPGDVHSDHRVAFEAATACSKWFRYPSVKRVLTYETLSETDASLDVCCNFKPTVFVNVESYLNKKCELLRLYKTEMGDLPFPRSEGAVRALATVRGVQAGMVAAEAFCLLRERI